MWKASAEEYQPILSFEYIWQIQRSCLKFYKSFDIHCFHFFNFLQQEMGRKQYLSSSSSNFNFQTLHIPMLLVFFKGGTDRSGINRHLETPFSRIIHINGQWVVQGEWVEVNYVCKVKEFRTFLWNHYTGSSERYSGAFQFPTQSGFGYKLAARSRNSIQSMIENNIL